MTTSTRNATTALLLIDPLNDFLSDGGKLWPYARDVAARLQLCDNLQLLLATARASGTTVIFVPHRRYKKDDFDGWKFVSPSHERARTIWPFLRDSWGAAYHPDLVPQAGEPIAGEYWLHNAFANTDLAFQLQIRGIDRVLIAGMRANTCVEATARQAVELGLHVTIVKDASGAFKWEEWVATMEVSGPSIVHAIVSTDEAVQHMTGAQP
jgi:nicotinamidase-related amidase